MALFVSCLPPLIYELAIFCQCERTYVNKKIPINVPVIQVRRVGSFAFFSEVDNKCVPPIARLHFDAVFAAAQLAYSLPRFRSKF